jgi:HEAT repeat protein
MFTNRDVGRLERELRSAEAHVKTRALRKIGRLSPDARAALFAVHNTAWSPLLLGSLLALETGTALEAASIERVAVETLARALGGRNVARRRAARIALVHGNVSLAAAQPILERLARDRRVAVRAAVGDVFSWGTRLETSDIALVEEMLRDPWLRGVGATTAAHLFRRLLAAITGAVALPAGKTISKSIPPIGRSATVHALAEGLRALPDLGSGLVGAVASRDPGVRAAAVRGLDSMGAATSNATPALVRALADRDTRVSDDAFRALRALKRSIDVSGSELQAMLESRLPHVRANAVRFLPFARTNPPSTWEPFLRALDDPAVEVKSATAETLRHSFHEVPDELLARLGRLARSRPVTAVRMTAAHSVAHLAKGDGAAVRDAIASLVVGLRARDAKVRILASYALSCLGEIALGALPDLLRVAESDPDFNVRTRALWAFRSMGPRAKRAAPLLRRLLRDSNEHIRRFAGEALAAVEGRNRSLNRSPRSST